jgi:hypothetical protein
MIKEYIVRVEGEYYTDLEIKAKSNEELTFKEKVFEGWLIV